LCGFEIITGVVLADEEWTPQNVSFNLPSLVIWLLMFSRVLPPLLRKSTGEESSRSTRRRLTRLTASPKAVDCHGMVGLGGFWQRWGFWRFHFSSASS
jgi:hypothetical protein